MLWYCIIYVIFSLGMANDNFLMQNFMISNYFNRSSLYKFWSEITSAKYCMQYMISCGLSFMCWDGHLNEVLGIRGSE